MQNMRRRPLWAMILRWLLRTVGLLLSFWIKYQIYSFVLSFIHTLQNMWSTYLVFLVYCLLVHIVLYIWNTCTFETNINHKLIQWYHFCGVLVVQNIFQRKIVKMTFPPYLKNLYLYKAICIRRRRNFKSLLSQFKTKAT